jgi:glycine betaine/proline transport system ATP-binding protein
MSKYIEVNDLELIFGKGQKLQKAITMLHEGKTNEDIRNETGCAVGVRKVNFHINKGEFFVIVGLSGSGKSSLIRCFNRLNTPTGGNIRIEGKIVNDLSRQDLLQLRRDEISMVFQNFGLLSHRSVLKNVEYGLEVKKEDKASREAKALEAIDVVGLKGWEHYHPHQLSGGMRQRVGLARALANNPNVLLMDEPYSALDPLIRRDMQNELMNLEDYIDKTIIFITHDMNEAFKLGDRIALMKDGEIVQLGKPSDFFTNPANDYVKDFIADVDKTQVLRAKQVMTPIEEDLNIDTQRTKARDIMVEKGLEFIYVTDRVGKYIGYVTLDDCKNKRNQTIEKLIRNDIEPFYRNLFISELIGPLSETDYEIPIVDSKNRLRGTISNEAILNAIS